MTFLALHHNVKLSTRHLHRLLRKQCLFRRHQKTPLNVIIDFVYKEIHERSGSCFGYRLMHQKLRARGYTVDRETVRIIIKSLDAENVMLRSSHRLVRRMYTSVGPNYLWHIDGYDKLKPFGFAIHGAIDGYSRKIMWLRAGISNNNPKIVCSYYLNCIKDLNLYPMSIRADRGSENVMICGVQRYFNRIKQSARPSFMYGSSVRNQRIESWWSLFKRSRSSWWINFFKDMCDEGIFDVSISYHLECIRFCFLGIIQTELDEVRILWNNHRIRKVRNSECPEGRPDVLFFSPSLTNGRECSYKIDKSDFQLAQGFSQDPPLLGCSKEMVELCSIIMKDKGYQLPNDADSAKDLFYSLVQEIDNL